ncbi:MAG: hypothetical protein QW117_03030 [Candidatus Pacearchaeota archaeon]
MKKESKNLDYVYINGVNLERRILKIFYNDFEELEKDKIPENFLIHYRLLNKMISNLPQEKKEKISNFYSLAKKQYDYLIAKIEYEKGKKSKKERLNNMKKSKKEVENILRKYEIFHSENKF